jgi:hypothetical protein
VADDERTGRDLILHVPQSGVSLLPLPLTVTPRHRTDRWTCRRPEVRACETASPDARCDWKCEGHRGRARPVA